MKGYYQQIAPLIILRPLLVRFDASSVMRAINGVIPEISNGLKGTGHFATPTTLPVSSN